MRNNEFNKYVSTDSAPANKVCNKVCVLCGDTPVQRYIVTGGHLHNTNDILCNRCGKRLRELAESIPASAQTGPASIVQHNKRSELTHRGGSDEKSVRSTVQSSENRRYWNMSQLLEKNDTWETPQFLLNNEGGNSEQTLEDESDWNMQQAPNNDWEKMAWQYNDDNGMFFAQA